MTSALRRPDALPGLAPLLGVSLFYGGLLILIPLGSVFLKAYDLSLAAFLAEVSSPRALAAYGLSFGASLAAAAVNSMLGLLVAWLLVRRASPGRRFADALVDLPFALPTAVAGIALTALLGAVSGAATPLGLWLALVLVGSPFAIRTLEPALRDLDTARGGRLAARAGVLVRIAPALRTGFTLAFARALAEYGAVVFIAGNLALPPELAPGLVLTPFEPHDPAGASAIAVVMLLVAFALLASSCAFQRAMPEPHAAR